MSEALSEEAQAQHDALHKGPLSLLMHAVKDKKPVMINCRNNKSLIARVKAFDRHFNMVLENVQEVWSEYPKKGKGKTISEPVMKDRFISKMFLRGDNVIIVVRDPK